MSVVRRARAGARISTWTIGALIVLLIGAVVTPAPATAGGPQDREFIVFCPYTLTLQGAPIESPGAYPSARLYDFFGSKSISWFSTDTVYNAKSNPHGMIGAPTTCSVPGDSAGYWTTSLYENGRRLPPTAPGFSPFAAYYSGTDFQRPGGTALSLVHTIPAGTDFLVGNPNATAGPFNYHMYWGCGDGSGIDGVRSHVPDCRSRNRPLELHVIFPDCLAVDSRGAPVVHVAGSPLTPAGYDQAGRCPTAYPYAIAQVIERVRWIDPTTGRAPAPAGITTSVNRATGGWWTMHADFWQTWYQPALNALVTGCIEEGLPSFCGNQYGNPPGS